MPQFSLCDFALHTSYKSTTKIGLTKHLPQDHSHKIGAEAIISELLWSCPTQLHLKMATDSCSTFELQHSIPIFIVSTALKIVYADSSSLL